MISDTLSFTASIAPGSTLLQSGPCGLGKLILLDSLKYFRIDILYNVFHARDDVEKWQKNFGMQFAKFAKVFYRQSFCLYGSGIVTILVTIDLACTNISN